MNAIHKQIQIPVQRGMLGIIRSESVYTPARAYMRWGYYRRCRLCGGKQGTWQHYIDDCPRTRKPPMRGISPPALRYSGNVPAHYLAEPDSAEMWRPTESGHEAHVVIGVPQCVGTDGSSKQRVVGRRRGCGVFWGAGDPCKLWEPVQGNVQTAARAEVHAALEAVSHAKTPFIITDSMGVYGQLKRLCRGGEEGERHTAIWRAATPHLHEVVDVVWAKTHLTPRRP